MKNLGTGLFILALSIPLLTGCNPSNEPAPQKQQKKPPQSNSSVSQPTQGNSDTRLILPDAMEEKKINLENVKTIELYELDGKKLDTQFTSDEITNIVKAYNESIIDDTSYIEMITGKRMVIGFKDGKKINIISYGNAERVVASGENFNYHLISPELAKILLAKY
jgi:hypothetical protein